MSVPHLVLINPNTDAATTARMLALARAEAGDRLHITGMTAPFGSSLIVNEDQLLNAARAVESLAPNLPANIAGVVVSAFGDPGLEGLRRRLTIPVVGIGEASMRAAAAGGRSFGVVTTTPGLVAAIELYVDRLELKEHYAGVFLTNGDAIAVTTNPDRLEAELALAISRAIEARGVEAVVIGGGPLGNAGRALSERFPATIVEPIPAAIRHFLSLIAEGLRLAVE